MSKKQNEKKKRDQIKNPGLNKRYNSKIRQEYLDQDYIPELSEAEKSWLSKFNEEYYGASLDFKNLENNMHNNQELKKDCTDRNNARNRCIYSIAKAKGVVVPTATNSANVESNSDNELEREEVTDNLEDYIIDYIDAKKD